MAHPRRSANQAEGASQHLPTFAVTRSVSDMTGETLKDYARKVGVAERDVQGLSESRLRQNCIVMVHESMD